MPVASGTRFGVYEVVAPLGAGGMGEVYRARDTRLGRDVALKMLPDSFAHDPERIARFEREAQILASLNHPHIAAIYGLEHAGESQFLVLELVEGETLAGRLASGTRDSGLGIRGSGPAESRTPKPESRHALAIDEALAIARQIADALQAAHEKGIIHRDLKPANVALTADGQVKVLDFGLARLDASGAGQTAGAGADGLTHSPTLTFAGTQAGVILGTAAYMSPEQAKGRIADKRSDVWAFGCVLFEMLTGQRAFAGEDITDVITAIMRDDPDWSALPADLPDPIRVVLQRCLAKDRKARLADIAVVQFLLNEPTAAAITVAPSASGRGRRLSTAAWVVPSLVALVAVALLGWQWTRPSAARVVRLTIPVGDPVELRLNAGGSIAISADGTRVVYRGAAMGASIPMLMQRKLDEFTTTPLAGTDGAIGPFFSPDGQWVGFFTSDNLKKISINGGAPLTISRRPAGAPRGAVWAADDMIYFADNLGAIQRVPSAGGTPQPVVRGSGGERAQWPQLLPDGKSLLFVSRTGFNGSRIYAQSLDGGERHLVAEGGSAPHYVATGHVVYGRPEGLLAIPFDGRRLQATGSPRPVLESVSTNGASGLVEYAVSAAGTLVYVPGVARLDDTALVWVDRHGTETSARAARGGYVGVQLSPDGTKLAVQIQGVTSDIWIDDLTRDTRSRLTSEGSNAFPTWTPDGKRVTYQSQKADGSGNIYWKPADGSGPEERVTTTPGKLENPNSWTADGRVLAVETTGGGLEYVTMDPKPAAHALLESPWNKDTPRLSGDGKWLAYASEESGALQVYVQPFPALSGKWLISTDGGTAPRWRRDGRELYYVNGGKLMAVTITTEPSFAPSKPTLLFQGPNVTPGANSTYDVTADGQRFLMIKQGEQASVAHLNVVLNWLEDLKRR